jgi:membrane protein
MLGVPTPNPIESMPTSLPPPPAPPKGPASRILALLLGAALVKLSSGRRKEPQPNRGAAPKQGRDPRRRGAPAHADGRAEEVAEREADRGRKADSPSHIPAKGWKDIAWRVYAEFSKDRVLAVAAGVTFYGLLALFPAVGALVSLYGLFADAATINDHLATMSGFLPGGAMEIIGDQVKRIASKPSGTLGFAFFSGLAISLWSANAGMKAMFDALNIVYEEDEKRGFFKLNLTSLTFTLGAIVVILIAIGAVVVLPIVLKYVGLGGPIIDWLVYIGRWPALLAAILFGLAVLYRYGPSRDRAQWRWVSWGSGIAGVLWVAFSMLFSWYVGSFGNYNETYGSLGAAIGFMTWIWLSTTIVLVGGEINAELEHQTAKDTTEGPEEPLGTRQAKMADEVGAAAG